MLRKKTMRKTKVRPRSAPSLSQFHSAIGSQCTRNTMARQSFAIFQQRVQDSYKAMAKKKLVSRDRVKSMPRILSFDLLFVYIVFDT